MNYSPDLDNSANRRFVAEYQKAHKASPTTYAMASYDAAAVLDKALSLVTGDLSGETLNAAIGRVGQINSPRGGWQFNQIRSPAAAVVPPPGPAGRRRPDQQHHFGARHHRLTGCRVLVRTA